MKEFFKKIVIVVLALEAQMLLKRTRPKVVAVTGSVGKTLTKDAIYAVLKDHVHARKSEKSFNSDIGVPLTILGLSNAWSSPLGWLKNLFDGALHAVFPGNYPEVLVLEMGVDRPGDMKRLTSWIKPDVVVITRLPDVPVHVEYFASPEQVAEEKMELVRALTTDGVFIYNNDDQTVLQYVKDVRQQSFGFSRYSPSHFTASGDRILYDGSVPIGTEFTLRHINNEVQLRVLGSLGVQHTYNAAAAAAVGSVFGITLEDVARAFEGLVTMQGRMRIIPGIHDSILIDDTYNASPTACAHALETLGELKTKGRKIAVLGDMLELGQYSVREHERIGELAASRADMLVTLGVRSRKIAEGALEFGMSEKNILQYDDCERAGHELKQLVQKGDIILIKASQGLRAERVTKILMENPGQANELLVRQDRFWERK